MRRPDGPRYTRRPAPKPKEGERAPSEKNNILRITPIGGNEETGGRNCTLLEYNKELLIIDIGLQWPEEDMPGVDYIIPDLSSLKGKEKMIRGIIVTHGHYDHTGGVPHWAPKLGNPPIYTSDLTCAMLQKKMEDIAPEKKLRLNSIRSRQRIRLGAFRIEFFGLSHNIPGSMGIVVETPGGSVVHTGDFKLDPRAHINNRTDLDFIQTLGRRNITVLMCDSTNSYATGHQVSEEEVEKNVELMFSQTKGRMIVATFASLLSRVQQVLSAAEKFNRKVLVEGFSMKTNIEIGKKLGYIRVKPNTIITWEEAKKLPGNRYLILCTGAQGEDNAVLMRIANREHKYLRVERGDLVVFSSSVIPGNDRAVTRLKDGLLREGASIIDSKMLDIHAGGHAKQEDIADFIRLIKPRYFMPIEGNYGSLLENKQIAIRTGIPEKNVLIADNGQTVEVSNHQAYVTNQRIPIEYVFVDGLGIGDVNALVLRDRKQLAGDGMIIIVAQIQSRTGKVLKVDIISRGLTHMKEQGHFIGELISQSKKALVDHEPRVKPDQKDLRDKVRRALEKFVFTKTQRQPLILPIIIET